MFSPYLDTKSPDDKIGSVGVITTDGLEFEVRVIAVRRRYGHTDYKIVPIRGAGNRWAEQSKIRFD